VADPDRPAPAIDAEARQRRIFGALDRLRRARSARGVTVFLLEDLHWLDPGSAAFLENLVQAVPGVRVLVVLTFRPEYHAPWAHRAHYAQLPLLPLGDAATGELLADLLGAHASVDGVSDLVRQRTGGNPFYMEEVVQGLVEDGSLVGRRGAYALAHTIGELRIPPTVQAVLAARIDRLADREKAVLQTAALIGRHFTALLVGRVSGTSGADLEAALATLVEAELIYGTALYPVPEYAFKHALTEDVAYGSQLGKRRSAVHASVAAALTELESDRLDERASLIAHHYELGGDRLEAARWNARAAGWAGHSNPVEAMRHWRRVRSLTDKLDLVPDVTELAVTACPCSTTSGGSALKVKMAASPSPSRRRR
jgi:adenylate cyclase